MSENPEKFLVQVLILLSKILKKFEMLISAVANAATSHSHTPRVPFLAAKLATHCLIAVSRVAVLT
jgi:hypothetical protein